MRYFSMNGDPCSTCFNFNKSTVMREFDLLNESRWRGKVKPLYQRHRGNALPWFIEFFEEVLAADLDLKASALKPFTASGVDSSCYA